MDSSIETRSKRKQPPTPSNDRPMKQRRPEVQYVNGSASDSPVNGLLNHADLDYESDDAPSIAHIAATADTAEWQATIENVVKNVVSIHFCQTCSFDTDAAVSSEATGFVVDAEKGYILTNRVRALYRRRSGRAFRLTMRSML